MSDLAIRVDGIGKQYHLGAVRERYATLRDRIGQWTSPGRWFAGPAGNGSSFWALKNVSFEVKRGDVVGIIGRNGAGKSTLLKILSRITEPTEGEADIYGRVGSLLEVGTGFHPELTGRENVFLNGAILGMKRTEIARKFDEIVAFAEVERFIDTPVKHYSSGMYMRLAFAVAAHLEPEILIVDEVLAVGDAEFQRRCLGKMGEVAKGGRTVLFVSHNMSAVQALCTRAVLLQSGQIALEGEVTPVLTKYVSTRSSNSASTRLLGGGLVLERFEVMPNELTSGDPISVEFEISSEQDGVSFAHLCLILYSAYDVRVGIVDLRPQRPPFAVRFDRRLLIRCDVGAIRLVEGEYKFGLYAVSERSEVNLTDVCFFSIAAAPSKCKAGEGFVPYPAVHRGTVEFSYAISRFETDS